MQFSGKCWFRQKFVIVTICKNVLEKSSMPHQKPYIRSAQINVHCNICQRDMLSRFSNVFWMIHFLFQSEVSRETRFFNLLKLYVQAFQIEISTQLLKLQTFHLIHFTPVFPLGIFAGRSSIQWLEISHGFQQLPMVVQPPHQDWTKVRSIVIPHLVVCRHLDHIPVGIANRIASL